MQEPGEPRPRTRRRRPRSGPPRATPLRLIRKNSAAKTSRRSAKNKRRDTRSEALPLSCAARSTQRSTKTSEPSAPKRRTKRISSSKVAGTTTSSAPASHEPAVPMPSRAPADADPEEAGDVRDVVDRGVDPGAARRLAQGRARHLAVDPVEHRRELKQRARDDHAQRAGLRGEPGAREADQQAHRARRDRATSPSARKQPAEAAAHGPVEVARHDAVGGLGRQLQQPPRRVARVARGRERQRLRIGHRDWRQPLAGRAASPAK